MTRFQSQFFTRVYPVAMIRSVLIVLMAALTTPAIAQDYMAQRDRNLIWKYRKLHPCPSTGKVYGACPGWQLDHRIALRCGGTDSLDNMQWLNIREHKAKTREEARRCTKRKRAEAARPKSAE